MPDAAPRGDSLYVFPRKRWLAPPTWWCVSARGSASTMSTPASTPNPSFRGGASAVSWVNFYLFVLSLQCTYICCWIQLLLLPPTWSAWCATFPRCSSMRTGPCWATPSPPVTTGGATPSPTCTSLKPTSTGYPTPSSCWYPWRSSPHSPSSSWTQSWSSIWTNSSWGRDTRSTRSFPRKALLLTSAQYPVTLRGRTKRNLKARTE